MKQKKNLLALALASLALTCITSCSPGQSSSSEASQNPSGESSTSSSEEAKTSTSEGKASSYDSSLSSNDGSSSKTSQDASSSSKEASTSEGQEADGTIELETKSHEMLFGESYQLVAKTSSNQEVTWESSDTSVATVEDGTVVAVGAGEATITAKAGKAKATCLIKVSFGDILPSLNIANLSGDTLLLARGSSFALKGEVSFNGASYPCALAVKIEDTSVLSLSGNAVVGKSEGETHIIIRGDWNDFTNEAMSKRIKVSVNKNVSIYSEVTLSGATKVASSLELGLLSSWAGVSYETNAKVVFRVNDDGYETVASISSPDDGIVSVDENGTVTAKKRGVTRLNATYTDFNGAVFTSFIEVTVTCPVATYSEQVRISMESPFPLEQYFGKGASISYAKQGNTELSFTSTGIIKGLKAAGASSEPLLLLTSKGGYYFENTFIYTRALDASNFASTFLLSAGKIVDGYYILDDDIDEVVDMTSQISSYYQVGNSSNRYFKGTIDGQGHTIKAKVGREGIFGGLGETPLIKNTHFEFTFASSDSYCCGLARNNWTNNVKGWKTTLSNIYVTTTNYYDNSYALFETRFNDLTLNDIYVNLTLDESCKEVTSAKQEKGALFRVDDTMTSGPSTQFSGDFRNIYVVSGVFMPISSGYKTKTETSVELFATYAYNDVLAHLGQVSHANVDTTTGYCVIRPADGNDKGALFGDLARATWFFHDDNTNIAYAYYASPTVNNGGVKRYDTVNDLLKEDVTKVGSWEVK